MALCPLTFSTHFNKSLVFVTENDISHWPLLVIISELKQNNCVRILFLKHWNFHLISDIAHNCTEMTLSVFSPETLYKLFHDNVINIPFFSENNHLLYDKSFPWQSSSKLSMIPWFSLAYPCPSHDAWTFLNLEYLDPSHYLLTWWIIYQRSHLD